MSRDKRVNPTARFRKCRILALSTGLTAYNYKRPLATLTGLCVRERFTGRTHCAVRVDNSCFDRQTTAFTVCGLRRAPTGIPRTQVRV